MYFRSDKISGTLTGLIGGSMICFAIFGLAIVIFQQIVVALAEKELATDPVMQLMKATHAVFYFYLPLMAVGGIVFAISGYYITKGNKVARRISQINAVLGYVWSIAYTVSSYKIVEQIGIHDQLGGPAFKWISLVSGSVILLVFPTLLLYILSRPKPTF